MEPFPLILIGIIGVVALVAVVGLVRSVVRLIFAALSGIIVAGLAYVAVQSFSIVDNVPSLAFLVLGGLTTLFILAKS